MSFSVESVLYFSIVDTSLVNCMYQTSLDQFLTIFSKSMDVAEKAALASKRVNNIIESMTYLTYRYINRGLYEKDKLSFVLMVTLKILLVAKQLQPSDIMLFLKGLDPVFPLASTPFAKTNFVSLLVCNEIALRCMSI